MLRWYRKAVTCLRHLVSASCGVDSLSQTAGVLDRAYALAFNRRVSTSLVFIIGVIGIAIGVIAGIAIWVLTRKKK